MKKLTLLVSMICVIMSLGCDKEETRPEVPVEGMADVVVTMTPSGCSQNDHCQYEVDVSWTDFAQGLRCYQVLFSGADMDYATDVIENAGPDANGTREVSFHIPYYSNLAGDSYEVNVYKLPSCEAAFKQRLAAATSEVFLTTENFDTDCYSKSCTNPDPAKRWYAQGVEFAADVDGAVCEITFWDDAQLCGCSSSEPSSSASVSVIAFDGQTRLWVQAGFAVKRLDPWTVSALAYFEYGAHVDGLLLLHEWTEVILDTPPTSGESHEFMVEFNTLNGYVSLHVDDIQEVDDYAHDFLGVAGDHSIYQCEINYIESDMMGLSSDQDYCKLNNCALRVNRGNYYPANFDFPENYGTSDSTEWGLSRHLNGSNWNSIWIWDMNPLSQ